MTPLKIIYIYYTQMTLEKENWLFTTVRRGEEIQEENKTNRQGPKKLDTRDTVLTSTIDTLNGLKMVNFYLIIYKMVERV